MFDKNLDIEFLLEDIRDFIRLIIFGELSHEYVVILLENLIELYKELEGPDKDKIYFMLQVISCIENEGYSEFIKVRGV